jgi:hypothetical protein
VPCHLDSKLSHFDTLQCCQWRRRFIVQTNTGGSSTTKLVSIWALSGLRLLVPATSVLHVHAQEMPRKATASARAIRDLTPEAIRTHTHYLYKPFIVFTTLPLVSIMMKQHITFRGRMVEHTQ